MKTGLHISSYDAFDFQVLNRENGNITPYNPYTIDIEIYIYNIETHTHTYIYIYIFIYTHIFSLIAY